MTDKTIIPVVEEELEVGKVRRDKGGVRVDKTVHEERRSVDTRLQADRLEVERVPLRRPVDGPVPDRWEGDTLVMSVLEEVVVVEKRLQVVEEIRITRHKEERPFHTDVTLRKETADVRRIET